MNNHLSESDVKDFYESVNDVWPANNMWHEINQNEINCFIKKINFKDDFIILNAGSGGNEYGLKQKIINIDISKRHNKYLKHFIQGNVESIPFENDFFDAAICVGSVINYCDAIRTINELSRVIKPGGKLVLEFESSYSYEYINTEAYMQSAALITTSYFNKPHRMWVYSPKYILGLLKCSNFYIKKCRPYHIISGMVIHVTNNENKAAKYAYMDGLFRHIPTIRWHSGNIIVYCIKQ